ncbi:hypothetical protein [Salinisphaera sp.]|uniref:hypothetical protein n=1 Tax=Salinisphaera sp. TaxID=1914330 RepID=UPI002D775748|nr:hypothetical protein [Salinisphaera sp.]HET7315421.1 hypothetical protein [Salinisphaera sp.]
MHDSIGDRACYRVPGASRFDRREHAAWWVATFLISLLLTGLQFTTTAPFKLAGFELMAHFNATEPFQCRVLVPAIVAGVQYLVPLGPKIVFGAVELVFWMALIALAYRALERFGIARNELIRRLLALTVVVPMVAHLLMPDLHVASGFSAADGVLDLGVWRAWPLFYYPYDLPAAVFTLALCLLLMRLRKSPSRGVLLVFVVLFTIATANRETTIFLLPTTALLLWGRLPTTQLLALGVVLLAVFLAVELPLYWLFSDMQNPNRRIASTQYESHLLSNLGFFRSPFYAAWFVTRFAGGLALVALFWWRFVDRRLKIVLITFALPLFCFAMWVGRLPEHRIFSEMVPLIWLAAMGAIAARAGCRERPDLRGDTDGV